MNRIIIIIFLSSLIMSCSTSDKETSNADNLKYYKEQVGVLNEKIAEIENKNKNLKYTGLEIPVKVKSIEQQTFSHNFIATGELESIEEAYISPEIAGQIISVNVTEGQYVKKDQVLAKLNTIIIENTISEVKTQLSLAKILFEKQSVLWNKNIGSEQQYLQAENGYENLKNKLVTLNAQYDMAIIKSPIDGIIEQIFLKKGELASPGMQFMQIVNIDQLYVTLKLSEAYLSSIKKGDIVDISFPSYPGITFREPVYRTGNVISKQNRTFVVQLKIDNNNEKLKPNLLTNVNINDYNTDKAIVIPSIIIKEDMKGSFVYVIGKDKGNDVAVKKYIKTGISYRDKTEVIEGLVAGDVIITDGYNNVSNGSVVVIVDL